ncbi:MAG: ATP synthase F0 subunit A [Planctomycetes bacterium RIFCSPHIGHO2_02_FULL_50_42]|nr:MAG: ATP synthase F0 subunit A [Planctomycetes bacterium GWA2_50_13]OHB90608.1 MAG: ATP synthase F0 subunit A [Planctomycetes bacterium RIFCSPHIGHO2_02_FULL_50_42]OHB94724.1 MAG: ATP synthase F0 subunit A [Planctomycetes bacterium RIFCSPLOWO2_02_FULL_50_16]OHC04099.1 MAG: ATP synthase F0 subunit A [Planctomycetes bacterium RIFCSPLOWO2_12_FULL_50_35]
MPCFLELFVGKDFTLFGLTEEQLVPVVISGIIIIFLSFLSISVTSRLEKIPGTMQALLELVVEGLDDFIESQMGHVGRAFLPFLGSLFIYILFMNLIGQIPLFHSPTANYNTTLALTLIVFLVTQYQGIKTRGPVGYIRHFVGDPLWMAPIFFPLHIIQEFLARPLSLSVRLFGNLMGEHTVLAIFIGFSPLLLGFIPIPIQLPIVLLDMLCATLQAIIFFLLACFYISSAMGVHDEH